MILRNVHSPFFIGFIVLLFFTSCSKNTKETISYKTSIAKAESFLESQTYDSAFYYYNTIKNLCNENNDTKNIIYPMLRMGEIQSVQGDLQSSEETFTEALPYLKKNPQNDYLAFLYNSLAMIYLEQHNPNEAFNYYQKSWSITTDSLKRCILKNNIAYNYMKQKNYSKAITLLKSLKNSDTLKNHDTDWARVLDNLGFSYLNKNNYTSSKEYLEQAKKIREKAKDSLGLTASFIHLAEWYKNSNPILANQHALYALKTATKVKNTNDRLEALSFLIQHENATLSKKYAVLYLKLNDSITGVQQKAKNQFAKIKYDSKQALLEAQQQKAMKEYFILGLICFVSFSIYIYYRIKKRNLKKLQETTYTTEIRIAKKLHDELANDVHNTITFIDTQDFQKPENKEHLLHNLDTIYHRTRNISNENSTIDTGKNYFENFKSMVGLYQNSQRNILLQFENFYVEKINPELKIIVYRVVQELLVNMNKHSQATLVVLKIENTKKTLYITYSDNGVGTQNKNFKKNGIQNVENRIFSVNGTLTFDTHKGKGFKTHISIPL
ncbi:tetratricopeptide repeat protein [Flavobacterium croceum DSM 17960]|uniref:histidine kinase n=1 Tax=Flavobacterium croceum DSM 17960 TaxID=1121886 RepID=A0A2S4N4R4_9FLAO|nr:tetratricopeptide repeat-containing sensor histidine kinase [Flavobacterium croceum]POS00707.1 tetratricopeptide repeat protein [Flavobacterium croceum DSM 17960]